MRIQIIAKIEGLFLLGRPVIAKRHPYEFAVFEENGSRYISITKPIINYEDVAPKLYSNNGIPQIEATKYEAYKDMEQWMIYIEAMGAFNFEIKKIHLDQLEVRWIYDTEDEKGSIPITSLKRNRVCAKAEKYLSNSNLSNLVIFQRALPDAHIPFSYYRQAKNFFDNHDYYFAFINYFMMLEFVFADGKFKTVDMTSNFKKSILLELCVLQALNMLKSKDDKGINYRWLLKECETRKKSLDFEGIIYILIEYRGLLSHASKKSKQYLLDAELLRPITFFVSLICFLLCGNMQVYCCSSEESRNRRIIQLIEELKKNE